MENLLSMLIEWLQKWISSNGGKDLDFSDIKNIVRERVQEWLDFRRDFTDTEVGDIVDEVILQSEEVTILSIPQRRVLQKEIFDNSDKVRDVYFEMNNGGHFADVADRILKGMMFIIDRDN